MSGRLSGYGPKKKMFEDLPPGDYFGEIGPPSEKGWLNTWVVPEDEELSKTSVNWRINVLSPEEYHGRVHWHKTALSVSEAQQALYKPGYDPSKKTYEFVRDIGCGFTEAGETIIGDEYLTDGDLDLDKMVGVRFNFSLREEPSFTDATKKVIRLTKAWPE